MCYSWEFFRLLVNVVRQAESYVKCLNKPVVTRCKEICLLEEVSFAYAVSFLGRHGFVYSGSGWDGSVVA